MSMNWVHSGWQGEYRWLELEGDVPAQAVRMAFPELEHERAVIAAPEQEGVEEVYFFDQRPAAAEFFRGDPFAEEPKAGEVRLFMKWATFRLSDEGEPFLREWFWKQMEWMRPEAYLGARPGCLVLVARDGELVERVCDYLYELAS